VQGTVRWPQDIDDFVILRSDGTPTYMLAVVVDDHDMGVTHVIRGDDHLNNAFRQNSIYQAMGWPIPVYAHIPLIYNQQGKKLSKRDGAAAVEDYRDELGIPANAMINYLARLGWGHGDDEIFSKAQAIEWFDIKDVGRNPARIDPKRLSSIAGQYIRASDDAALAATILPKLLLAGHDVDQKVLVKSMASLKDRSSDLNKLAEGTHFLWNKRPLQLSEPLSDPDKDILHEVNQGLEAICWLDDQMATVMHDVSESNELKLGKVVAPLRMALTGQRNSPPIYDVMKLLGRNETLARIKDAL
jgi:glutamyl-tRNA synthetase